MMRLPLSLTNFLPHLHSDKIDTWSIGSGKTFLHPQNHFCINQIPLSQIRIHQYGVGPVKLSPIPLTAFTLMYTTKV